MSALTHLFRVRLCNFKAHGLRGLQRSHPPYSLRINFGDQETLMSEPFAAEVMHPMWALDRRFDYHAPTVDSLKTQYLVLECFGAEDSFIGMGRMDLFSIATASSQIELELLDSNGMPTGTVIAFECFMDHVTNASIQLAAFRIQQLPMRGDGSPPSAYLAFGVLGHGLSIETIVAPSSTCPLWDRLPPVHRLCAYPELRSTTIRFELKHARNGYSPGLSDPVMAVFNLALGNIAIEVGRETVVPFQQMIHSTPEYSTPFSARLTCNIEVRNPPRIVQLQHTAMASARGFSHAAATMMSPPRCTNSAISSTNGHHQASPIRAAAHRQYTNLTSSSSSNKVAKSVVSFSPSRGSTHEASSALHSTVESSPPAIGLESYVISPQRSPVRSAAGSSSSAIAMIAGGGARGHHHGVDVRTPHNSAPRGFQVIATPPVVPPMPTSAEVLLSDDAVTQDVEILCQVAEKQEALLTRVKKRLQEVTQRRMEVESRIQAVEDAEAAAEESAEAEIQALEQEYATAIRERDALNAARASIAAQRDEVERIAAQQAEERAQAMAEIEKEELEIREQLRVVQGLRDEMMKHLAEEEERFKARLAEAEEERRQTEADEMELDDLERRIAEAELRAQQRRAEEQNAKAQALNTIRSSSHASSHESGSSGSGGNNNGHYRNNTGCRPATASSSYQQQPRMTVQGGCTESRYRSPTRRPRY